MISFPYQPRKILVVKPSSLGDIIHSMPFLHTLKHNFKDADIHWLVANDFSHLIAGHPLISRHWTINKSQWKRPLKAIDTINELRILKNSLRDEKFDLAVDLQGLFRSGLLTALSGARVRVGFKEAREGSTVFYTHKVEGGRDIHAVDRYLRIADALGCEKTHVEFPMIYEEYPFSFNDYAVFAPGARWESKIWPAENFGTLASLLPIKSVIIGSRSDAARAEVVDNHSMGKAVNLVGKTTLKELSGLIKKARFMVTNDSGPMHIAAAFGVPVFALFGPTSPERTGPYGTGHTIIRSNAPCSPCFKKRCRDPYCIEGISPAQVLEAIKEKGVLTF